MTASIKVTLDTKNIHDVQTLVMTLNNALMHAKYDAEIKIEYPMVEIAAV